MSDAALTPERILATAEDVLRRYGPDKATVVDVARALGVSHGSVYRHFASKAALREAVVAAWLARVSAPLAAIAHAKAPPADRLRRWFARLVDIKRAKVLDDPEVFSAYSTLAAEAGGDFVQTHVDDLVGQVEAILADGVADGSFSVDDVRATALGLFNATARFHHPLHAGEWRRTGVAREFDALWALLERGITVPRSPRAPAPRTSRRTRA